MALPILTPNELDLSFPAPDDCAKFHQILFKIATVRAMTDRHTERHTDRQTPVILLSAPCYAIAMGQIIICYYTTQGKIQ